MEDEEAGRFVLQTEAPELTELLRQSDPVTRQQTGGLRSRPPAHHLTALDAPQTSGLARHHLPGPAPEIHSSQFMYGNGYMGYGGI